MKRFIKITIPLFILCACNGNQETAGGPCSYTHQYHPIVVTKRQAINPNSFDLLFVNLTNHDTLNYHSINHYYLDSTCKLKPGDTCRLKESSIQSGSCNPHIYHIDTSLGF